MRITLEHIKQARASIDGMEIVSLEGQRYLVRLNLGGKTWLLSDGQGESLLFRSAWEAQDRLADYTASTATVELVHPSAYGEMVGLDDQPLEPLRLPLRSSR